MQVLITGGAGFVGSHLADALIARGDKVIALDDLSTGRRENIEQHLDGGQVELVDGSVLDADLVGDCMRRADVCMHLASAVGVQLVVDKPLESLQLNVRGNDIVISAAAEQGRRLLFTSTSEIYGKNSEDGIKETSDRILGSPYKARWAYATAKAYGEHLAYAHHRERGAEVVVARIFNTVGPRQTGFYGMVLPRFVRQGLAGELLTVDGNGTQSRCFTHVFDTVHALLLLMDSEDTTGGVYNVGCPTEVPIVELARRVIERCESPSTVKFVAYEDAYGEGFEELGRRKPDITAIKEITGWTPSRDVDEAIDDVIAFERSTGSSAGRLRLAG
jgi:UDP-glucose 4-epimerase